MECVFEYEYKQGGRTKKVFSWKMLEKYNFIYLSLVCVKSVCCVYYHVFVVVVVVLNIVVAVQVLCTCQHYTL